MGKRRVAAEHGAVAAERVEREGVALRENKRVSSIDERRDFTGLPAPASAAPRWHDMCRTQARP